MRVALKDIEAVKARIKGKSKYGNKKVIVDGIKFDSKIEAARYGELKMLLRAGKITDLKLQVAYELNPGGTFSYKYKCDFQYMENGKLVVEDSKGCITAVFRKKEKLMKKVFDIVIKRV